MTNWMADQATWSLWARPLRLDTGNRPVKVNYSTSGHHMAIHSVL